MCVELKSGAEVEAGKHGENVIRILFTPQRIVIRGPSSTHVPNVYAILIKNSIQPTILLGDVEQCSRTLGLPLFTSIVNGNLEWFWS